MKDSVRGLTEKGNSVLLLELAKKVGSMSEMVDEATKSVAQSQVNVVEMTVLGGQNGMLNMDAIEEEPMGENVFVMEETGDFFLTYETSEGIVVKDGVGNDEVVASWDMGLYKSLRELIIGDGCFAYMAGLKLEGMAVLEKVEIGGECFSMAEGTMEVVNCVKLKCLKIGSDSCVGWSEFMMRNCGVEEVEIGRECFSMAEGIVEVVNCEKLKHLKIDSGSCVGWSEFMLDRCGAEEIEIGSGCFSKSKGVLKLVDCVKLGHLKIRSDSCVGWGEFVLKNCVVEEVEIGSGCFSKSKGVLKLVECVKLKHLKIGSDSCVGWSEFVLKNCGVEEIEIGDGCFLNCEKIVLEGLKELNSLIIDWNTFLNVKDATFVNTPNLSQVSLGNAFSFVETVTMSNASLIEQESRKEVIVRNRKELYGASHFNGRVVFTSRACFPAFFASVDISHFTVLCELIIGDGCFRNVKGLELRGKQYLEKVEIGSGCFSKSKGVLKVVDCVKLKHLKIGNDSCVEWSEFVMRDCGVEEVEIGDGCFVNCEKTTIVDLVALKELRIGKEVFQGRKNAKNELTMRSGKGIEE